MFGHWLKYFRISGIRPFVFPVDEGENFIIEFHISSLAIALMYVLDRIILKIVHM